MGEISMTRERGGRSAAGDDALGEGGSQAPDPRHAALAARVRSARAFNEAHADLVAQFNQATGGACAGAEGGVDIRKVIAWQRAHGLKGDGKIGKDTVKAAEREAGQSAGDFFEGEGVAEEGPVLENPAFMEDVSGGAEGMDARDDKRPSEDLAGAGETADRVHKAAHLAAGHFPTNDALGGEVEAGSPWIKAAMAPAILQMLREGDYGGAIWELAKTFSPSEYMEGLTIACKRFGIHRAVPILEKWAAYGVAADAAAEMMMWSYEGLKSIGEAHEAGDRDSRIAMYASAFADAFLYGDGAGENPGAVTVEQKEAVEHGRRDGAATAGRTGELAPVIGKVLLKKYGSAHNTKQAIVDELMKNAGFKKISLHDAPKQARSNEDGT
jgi:hypothetical protein